MMEVDVTMSSGRRPGSTCLANARNGPPLVEYVFFKCGVRKTEKECGCVVCVVVWLGYSGSYDSNHSSF
jgi:hypothetical protein